MGVGGSLDDIGRTIWWHLSSCSRSAQSRFCRRGLVNTDILQQDRLQCDGILSTVRLKHRALKFDQTALGKLDHRRPSHNDAVSVPRAAPLQVRQVPSFVFVGVCLRAVSWEHATLCGRAGCVVRGWVGTVWTSATWHGWQIHRLRGLSTSLDFPIVHGMA